MKHTTKWFVANNFDSIADSIYSVENLHPYIGFEVINKGESLVWNFILPPATDPMNFIIYQAVVKRDGDGFKVTLTAEDNSVDGHKEVLSEKVERVGEVTDTVLSMVEKVESELAKTEDKEYLKALNTYAEVLDNFRLNGVRSEVVDVYPDGLKTSLYAGGDRNILVRLDGDHLSINGRDAFSVKTPKGYMKMKEFRDKLTESVKRFLK